MKRTVFAVVICILGFLSSASAQETSTQEKHDAQSSEMKCPMHDTHSKMNERGEKGMGFSQTATVHHFLLKPDGGVIQVEAKNTADTNSRDDIRMHLTHIREAFSNGDFEIPMFVHDTVPPGVPAMKRLRDKIHYSFEQTSSGGRVVITTRDKDALEAIHEFLIFQIKEHDTGDPTEVR